LFALARQELFTAVVGDALDRLGYQRQFLPPHLRPLAPRMVIVGRALTVVEADLPPGASPAQPFGLMVRALDSLRPHEVYLCSGASPCYALWGELMTLRAQKCGAAGAVVNGYSRDTQAILPLGFPVFSRGPFAQDQGPRGQVVDFRCGLEIEGVQVRDGDIVFADIDGVLVVPREVEHACFLAALEKARGENQVKQALLAGMTSEEAFQKFGIM
jgi:regulator of RNase E activity RraA